MIETLKHYVDKYGYGEHLYSDGICVSVKKMSVTFMEISPDDEVSNLPDGLDIHRLDGPAIIYSYGGGDWVINGVIVTDEIKSWATQHGIDLDNLTEDDKVMIKLTWVDYSGRVLV